MQYYLPLASFLVLRMGPCTRWTSLFSYHGLNLRSGGADFNHQPKDRLLIGDIWSRGELIYIMTMFSRPLIFSEDII